MAGANPERTSWVSHETTGSMTVKWHRPIEAYIDQKTQIIAVGDSIYVATAKGLYCLDAISGSVNWTYPTELPLGHSPTVVNNVAYVSSLDRRIHAVSTLSGQRLWASDQAMAGFMVSPVVANGMVYAGSRDGRFYAFSTASGQKVWQYPPAGRAPLGPIALSAAYDSATDRLFFASDDNYAYALRASDGGLVWKSASKLPGDRYHSWWPVIFGQRVIFSGTKPFAWFDYDSDRYAGAPSYETAGYPGPVFTAGGTGDTTGISWRWPAGSRVMDAQWWQDKINGNPRLHMAQVHLDKNNGNEFSAERSPILWTGKNQHNLHPPVVMPDGVLYTTGQSHRGSAGITRSEVLGWHENSSYVRLTALNTAQDEPQYISGGGNRIYRNLCCGRVGDSINVTVPNPGTTQSMQYWQYSGNTLDAQLPGYHDLTAWTQPGFLENLRGWYHGQFQPGYRSPNGTYHSHGDQNPIVPHRASDNVTRLYVHRFNVVICYSPGTNTPVQLPLLAANRTVRDAPVLPASEVQARLEREVSKIVNAGGYLKAGYLNNGQNLVRQINEYFYNPGDLLYTLLRAYPLVGAGLQTQLRTYLQGYYDYYFGSTRYAYVGMAEPVFRNANDFPDEAITQFNAKPRSASSAGFGWSWNYPQNNIYGLWKYAQLFPAAVQDAYSKAKSMIEVRALSDTFGTTTYESYFFEYPFALHAYIAGYMGFLGLNDLAGNPSADAALRGNVQQRLGEFLQYQRSNFRKDAPYIDPATMLPVAGYNVHRQKLNLARNFLILYPEVAADMRTHLLTQVQQAVEEYNYVGPYWFVSDYEAGPQENTASPPADVEGLFQAKALILRQPYEELQKYIDAPRFVAGDLYYMNNLVALAESAGVTPDSTAPAAPRRLRTR